MDDWFDTVKHLGSTALKSLKTSLWDSGVIKKALATAAGAINPGLGMIADTALTAFGGKLNS